MLVVSLGLLCDSRRPLRHTSVRGRVATGNREHHPLLQAARPRLRASLFLDILPPRHVRAPSVSISNASSLSSLFLSPRPMIHRRLRRPSTTVSLHSKVSPACCRPSNYLPRWLPLSSRIAPGARQHLQLDDNDGGGYAPSEPSPALLYAARPEDAETQF
ncbi:hypothetical protein MSAN_02102700 [Mycena sanguinolenta]|uniref:Uncharacterized protein n=1 Tax=Mycena sanguinolenta TaxID=230812 RepID=A0A8H6XFY4_9AGAR|nr:hypothetical protein MSAN_02102700 [Mycena sanguinolenta]